MTNDLLEFLEKWYSAQCDGKWEHSFGVKIDTLDNPGWCVDIDLAGTKLAGKSFEPLIVLHGQEDWLRCSVEDDVFKIACSPHNLSRGLVSFRNWAEQPKSGNHSGADASARKE